MFVVTGSKKETKEIAIKKSGKKNDMCIESINEGKTKDNETDLSSLDEKELKLKQVEEELKEHKILGENFEVVNFLGSGSESDVFGIRNKKNKKVLVLKKILKHKIKTKNVNELKIASKMKQKNIIDFYGYSSSQKNNTEFIVMENAKFGNLRNFQIKTVKRSCLSESMLCYFIFQILDGLAYMHRCKIAHMDIKPQNIVIDEFLNAKIIDFSISINYKGKKPNDEFKLPFKGTNFYMPLEVLDEKKIKYKDLNKVDAYALGVLLYTLAFGCYPYDLTYEDSKDYKLIHQKMEKNLEFDNKNDLSSTFIDFVSKLLEKDINKRMSIYEALKHPWIKAAELLVLEKDNLYNITSFVIKLMIDGIKSFNDFVRMKK